MPGSLGLGASSRVLAGGPKPIPSPLTLPEAERLANVESENAKRLIEQAWQHVTGRLERLELDGALAGYPGSYTEEEDLVRLESARNWCGLVEEQANEAMGLSPRLWQEPPACICFPENQFLRLQASGSQNDDLILEHSR
jgi:hypothetical protein